MNSKKTKKQILKAFNPPQQRWSGLETDYMRLNGCSLLIPKDVYYQAGPYTLKPRRFQIAANKIVDFPGSQPICISAASKAFPPGGASVRILPLYMVIAGKVRFTPQDYDLFKISMQSAKEAKAMGRTPNSVWEWPDVRALCLCPICGTDQKPDGQQYWMVLHHCQQMHTKSFSVGTRQLPRLMCTGCFDSLWPVMTKGAGIRAEIIDRNPAFPVAGYAAPSIIMTVEENFAIWERSGMYQALDLKSRQESASVLQSVAGLNTHVANQFDVVDPMVELKRGACFVCDKKGDNTTTILKCSRCQQATYCSKECQRKDWKRHAFHCKK